MRLKLEAVATLGLWMFCSACVCHKLMMLQTEKFHLEIQIAAYEKWEEVAALGPHSRPVMVGASSTEGAPVLLPWLSPLATAPDCRLGVWVAPTPWSLTCCWLVAQRSASLLFLRTRCACSRQRGSSCCQQGRLGVWALSLCHLLFSSKLSVVQPLPGLGIGNSCLTEHLLGQPPSWVLGIEQYRVSVTQGDFGCKWQKPNSIAETDQEKGGGIYWLQIEMLMR